MNYAEKFHQYLNQWCLKKPFGYEFAPSVEYILNNPGKFIRPSLIYSIADELSSLSENHQKLALAIELHHTYTLVHDDLPSMDNDDTRRGRPTLHKVYGEATALLVGDILLGKSYEILSQIQDHNLSLILKLFSHATGSKGLILGQKMDLEFAQKNKNVEELARLFELKTARLFQFSLSASYTLASKNNFNPNMCKKFWRLGTACGVLFQLIDDYEDVRSDKKSDLNIFKLNADFAFGLTNKYEKIFKDLKLTLKNIIPNTIEDLEKLLLNKIAKN